MIFCLSFQNKNLSISHENLFKLGKELWACLPSHCYLVSLIESFDYHEGGASSFLKEEDISITSFSWGGKGSHSRNLLFEVLAFFKGSANFIFFSFENNETFSVSVADGTFSTAPFNYPIL